MDQFRREEGLKKTDAFRPDLIEKLECKDLTKSDAKLLIQLGWNLSGENPKRED